MEKYLQRAAELFHKPPRNYNCSQSVAEIAGETELAKTLQPLGGGRAEGGLCGALYVALQLTPEESHEKIKEEFAQLVGDLTCRDIKSKAKTSCQKCVAVGAMLVDKYRTNAGR